MCAIMRLCAKMVVLVATLVNAVKLVVVIEIEKIQIDN